MTVPPPLGTLYGLGLGPGDPELVTVKAFRILQQAPVVAYPERRPGDTGYALEIARPFLPPGRTLLGLHFPMTREAAALEREWDRSVEALWSHLREGRDVAFITEGDPMLYSTFLPLRRRMRDLHPQVPVQAVPGVSSVTAAASRLDIPLADGDTQLVVVPATADRSAMERALREHDTVVFLKIAKVLDLLLDLLEELGLTRQAAVASRLTAGDETLWHRVEELRGREVGYLTLMVVRRG